MKKLPASLSLLLFVLALTACVTGGSTFERTAQPLSSDTPPPTNAPPPTETPPPCDPLVYNESRLVLRRQYSKLEGNLSFLGAADFTGDGLDDVVLTRYVFGSAEAYPIEILVNNGSGDLILSTTEVFSGSIPTTQHPRQILLADFNGDGITDIFIADHGQDVEPFPGFQNTLALSVSDGKLMDATANLPQQHDFTHSAAAGDVDTDGDIDLYIGNFGINNLPQIWLNDGEGKFKIGEGLPAPVYWPNQSLKSHTSASFADVNNDGFPDLIRGGFTYVDSEILINDGNGNFSVLQGAYPTKPFHNENQALHIVPADVDGDSYLDLLVGYTIDWPYIGKYIRILINNRDGTFRDETESRLPQTNDDDDWIDRIFLHDIDYDGDLDITINVTLGEGDWTTILWDYPLFFLNDGSGHYTGADIDHHIVIPTYYTILDLYGDGYLDIFAVELPRSSNGNSEVEYLVEDIGCR